MFKIFRKIKNREEKTEEKTERVPLSIQKREGHPL
jgi:hypothetical protein